MSGIDNIRKKLENFWYHYKWHTIMTAAFVLILAVLIAQFAQRESFDAEMIYAGPAELTPNQISEIESAFALSLDGDRDGNGKKTVQLYHFFLLTADQIKAEEKKAEEEDVLYFPNNAQIMEARTQFTNQIYVGQALICLLDPEWYRLVRENDGFVPLGEIFDEVPEYAEDGYAVRLKDTPFAQYFSSAFSCLSDDTLLCFRRMSSTTALKNKKAEEERYEYNKKLFIRLIDFDLKNS